MPSQLLCSSFISCKTLTAHVGGAQFLTQPFVVGERVALLGGDGIAIVAGVVEAVTPMNTIVSACYPLPPASHAPPSTSRTHALLIACLQPPPHADH